MKDNPKCLPKWDTLKHFVDRKRFPGRVCARTVYGALCLASYGPNRVGNPIANEGAREKKIAP
jgi:hypothetical protein